MDAASPKPLSVFAYLDYGEYLKQAYLARKAKSRAFSHRYIAGKAGMTSAQLTRVFNGQRRLNPALAKALARVFGLKGDESEYFEALVLFGVAKSQAEKDHFMARIIRMRGTQMKILEEDQFRYFSAWYFTAIRELLNVHPFQGDYAELAARLQPPIKPAEAKAVMEFLLEQGMVLVDADGRHRLADPVVSSGRHVPAAVMNKMHFAMGELALRAIGMVHPSERNFSFLTLSLSPRSLDSIQDMARKFRREVLEVARQDSDADRVYQMNLQLFPLSTPAPMRLK